MTTTTSEASNITVIYLMDRVIVPKKSGLTRKCLSVEVIARIYVEFLRIIGHFCKHNSKQYYLEICCAHSTQA